MPSYSRGTKNFLLSGKCMLKGEKKMGYNEGWEYGRDVRSRRSSRATGGKMFVMASICRPLLFRALSPPLSGG
jgi:hypothetical protein